MRRIQYVFVLAISVMLVIVLVACSVDTATNETEAPRLVETQAPDQIVTAAPTVVPVRVSPTQVVQPVSEQPTATVAAPTAEVVATEAAITDSLSDPIFAILDAFRQLSDVQSLRVTSDVCSEFTNVTSRTFEFVQPDSYRYMSTFRDGSTEVEDVAIGDTLYLKRDETWEIRSIDAIIFSSDPSWTMTVGDDDDVEGLMNNAKESYRDVRKAGQESLDGRVMQVYQFETNDPPHHHTVWISETDSRFYRTSESWEVDDDDASYTCTVFTTYEYDLPLSIEAPVPSQ